MKTLRVRILLIFSLFIILLNFLYACNRDKVDLSEDAELKEDVFEQILSDEETFNEFMNKMRKNDRSMQWMSSHQPMMRSVYDRGRMRHMMENNPRVMDSVMLNMMFMIEEDSTLMYRNPKLQQRMLQHMFIMIDHDTAFSRQVKERMEQ